MAKSDIKEYELCPRCNRELEGVEGEPYARICLKCKIGSSDIRKSLFRPHVFVSYPFRQIRG